MWRVTLLRSELHVVLRDGTRALLRPIRPEDAWRIERGFELLSPMTRYLRFHQPVEHLTDEHIRYLTDVDGADHAAWIAIDEEHPEEPGMGVARYVRLTDEPDVAEAAITVVDAFQGRGVGTVLLGTLARTARANGISTFRNYVLAENTPMLDLLDQLGATRTDEDDIARVEIPIPSDPGELPATAAGRVLRAAARGDLRMLLSALVPVRIPPAPDAPVVTSDQERTDLARWLDETLNEPTPDDQT